MPVPDPASAPEPSGPTFHGRPIDPSLIIDVEEPWDEDRFGPEPEDPSFTLAPSRSARSGKSGNESAPQPSEPTSEEPVAPVPSEAPPAPSGEAPVAPVPGGAQGWTTPPRTSWGSPSAASPTEATPPAAPPAAPAKLSRYQRLMAQAKSSEQTWAATPPSAPETPPAQTPEDFVPSDDDEELENSTTFGRQAFERLLDATLIEELDSNGHPVPHHR